MSGLVFRALCALPEWLYAYDPPLSGHEVAETAGRRTGEARARAAGGYLRKLGWR